MSSKRAIRRKSCTGKVRYINEWSAKAAIHQLHGDKGYQGMMNGYACKFCGGYHIGHVPARVWIGMKAARGGA